MSPITAEDTLRIASEHQQAGRLAEAEQACREALSDAPQDPALLHLLGIVHGQTGRPEAAIEFFRMAIAIKPDFPEAFYNLGVALTENGRRDEAIAAYHQALSLKPSFLEAYSKLASSLTAAHRTEEAIEAHRRIIAIKPDSAEAHCNLGLALTAARRTDEVIAAFRQAIALKPDYPEAHYNLAVALVEKGLTDEVIASLRQAIAQRPGFSDAYYNLGVALCSQGRLKDAIAAYRKAVAIQPDHSLAHYNLGNVFRDQGKLDEAIAAYKQAVACKPRYLEALNNLAIVLKDAGRLDDCFAANRQAMTIDPGYVAAHSNLLMDLHYSPDSTPESLLEEHRRWSERHAVLFEQFVRPHANVRNPNRRLRIGYVSADFWNHAVARFVLPLLAGHDRAGFEIFCYSNVKTADRTTESIRRLADGWRNICGMGDDQAAGMIRDDRVDILVDLSLHTSGNRLLVFARKPAPVQVTWLGYASTTGLNSIDWRLTDPYMDPPGGSAADHAAHYSEKSIRLPHCFWCYQPVEHAGDVNALRAIETGQISFACFNNFAKVSVPAQELWAELMSQIPGSRLAIHSHLGSHRAALLERFSRKGIEADRIEFVGRLSMTDYLRRYRKVDIALDPFPFGGGTTTCDALWMGVPVVTLRGRTAVGRGGASILSNLGMTDWIADTPEQYLQIAREKSADLPKLAMLRATLRDRMRRSPLMDGRRFARDMESAFQMMWRNWCEAGK